MLCEICIEGKANYGLKNGKKQYCKDCYKSVPNTCNLTKKICKYEECLSEPNFNFHDVKGGVYCAKHKLDGMIDVKHKKCEYQNDTDFKDGCKLLPSYGIRGQKAKYCLAHSKLFENMVIISNRLCKFKDETEELCTSRASYNIEGKKTGMYCKQHKTEGMIYVLKVDFCEEADCKTRPSFNFIDQDKPIYCNKHKKENMINIKDNRCITDNCLTIASYNFANTKKYLYCNDHKLQDMINLRSKKCEFDGCNSLPTYNKIGETIKRFCAKHKEKDMINVKCKKCIEPGCNMEALCNFVGEKKRLYCCRHKMNLMVSLCDTICKYNSVSNCNTKGNKKYDLYCQRCYIGLFPNEKITRNFKTKELRVCEFIKENFTEYTIQFDRIIADGCSKRRPDIHIDMGNYTIIIEVDENQHDTYENICENKRIMLIFNDLGSRPMHLIRFNPDQYYNDKQEIVKSCWSFSRDGMAIINRNKRDEWKVRLNTLKNTLTYCIANEPKKEIDIKYLYYDEKIQI
jgi:hypothetical protein